MKKPRSWKQYRSTQCGEVALRFEEIPCSGRFKLGLIETGRQEVFAGYFVWMADGLNPPWVGEHPHSLRLALHAAADEARSAGAFLECAGLDQQWYKSGLSANTGYGSLGDREEAIHLLARSRQISENKN